MSTAQRIFEEVRTLPEAAALEALDFVGFLETRQAPSEAFKAQAKAVLAQYRGRYKAVKFSRDELYERGLRNPVFGRFAKWPGIRWPSEGGKPLHMTSETCPTYSNS